MKPGTIIKDPKELEPGRWYAIGICNEFDEIEWGGAQLLKFVSHVGRGEWLDEQGEVVEFILDPVIQDDIRVSDADAFLLQS